MYGKTCFPPGAAGLGTVEASLTCTALHAMIVLCTSQLDETLTFWRFNVLRGCPRNVNVAQVHVLDRGTRALRKDLIEYLGDVSLVVKLSSISRSLCIFSSVIESTEALQTNIKTTGQLDIPPGERTIAHCLSTEFGLHRSKISKATPPRGGASLEGRDRSDELRGGLVRYTALLSIVTCSITSGPCALRNLARLSSV